MSRKIFFVVSIALGWFSVPAMHAALIQSLIATYDTTNNSVRYQLTLTNLVDASTPNGVSTITFDSDPLGGSLWNPTFGTLGTHSPAGLQFQTSAVGFFLHTFKLATPATSGTLNFDVIITDLDPVDLATLDAEVGAGRGVDPIFNGNFGGLSSDVAGTQSAEDFSFWVSGSISPGGEATVPEPGTVTLAMLAAIGLIFGTRRFSAAGDRK